MSVKRVCFNCGSSSFVSDRSLGGKIVCSKCGSSSFKRPSSFLKNKKFIIFFIAIAILIIFI